MSEGRPPRSGIPLFKRRTPKPGNTVPVDAVRAPPSEGSGDERPDHAGKKNNVHEACYRRMDIDNRAGFSESISVKSAANMFGGQAVIRRIPTPSSQRRIPKPAPPKPTPPKVPAKPFLKKPNAGLNATGGDSSLDTGEGNAGNKERPKRDQLDKVENKENMAHNLKCGQNGIDEDEKDWDPFGSEFQAGNAGINSNGKNVSKNIGQELDGETDDDVLDKPLKSLSEINGISDECETYDNVEETDNIPSYEQFMSGAGNFIDVDEDDNDLDNVDIPDTVTDMEHCENVLPQSVKKLAKEYACLRKTESGIMRVSLSSDYQKSQEAINSLKDKLQVPENGYRFSQAGNCDVCDTHYLLRSGSAERPGYHRTGDMYGQ
ncbi:hypothetical protein MAR_001155, partial [Mya arenaria]